jgi:hypothetical protein
VIGHQGAEHLGDDREHDVPGGAQKLVREAAPSTAAEEGNDRRANNGHPD